MSRIHALQSSTTSHKLLQSVRSLRPFLCEALRASGCDTTLISEQDPILLHVDQSLQNAADVQGLANNAPASSGLPQHRVDVQEELANCHTFSFSDSNFHDLDVNAQCGYPGHMHENCLHVQHHDSRHVMHQSHKYAVNVGHVQSLADVQRHVYGQYGDAHHQGNAKDFNTEYGDAPLHHGDAQHCDMEMCHMHGHHCDAHGSSLNAYFPLPVDYSSELSHLPSDQDQILRMTFRQSFSMTVEPSINIDPYTPPSCIQYFEGADQHIHACHHHSLQQHFASETTGFVDTMLLEDPGSITDDTLGGAEATSKISDSIYECMHLQDLSSSGMHNVNFLCGEVPTGLQAEEEELVHSQWESLTCTSQDIRSCKASMKHRISKEEGVAKGSC